MAIPITTRISPHIPSTGRIMVTDGGPHPPEAWAQITAEHIAPLGPNLVGERHRRAVELQFKIAELLEPIYKTAQETERSGLTADTARVAVPVDPEPHLDAAIAAIQAAAKGTEWEGHFSDAEVVKLVRREVGIHIATTQHIEKSWHADRNPTHPAAQAFRATHHPGVKE
jgi:hypothetical protein